MKLIELRPARIAVMPDVLQAVCHWLLVSIDGTTQFLTTDERGWEGDFYTNWRELPRIEIRANSCQFA
jgi:hypothetical protein